MNFQPPSTDEMQKKKEEGGNSNGAKSCTKPPFPCFKISPLLVDEIHPVLPTNNENSSHAASPKGSIARLSLMTDEELIEFEQKNGRSIDPENVDIKKLKRTIANRLSAQKSRLKKFQKIEEMENKVRELEENINAIKFQIESYTKNQEMARMENIMMEQRLDYLSKRSNLTNKEIEENKAEALWLREFLQIMKENALNAEKEKLKRFSVDQCEELVPDLQNHQSFNDHPNGEHQNLGEISDQFFNMDDFIDYEQSSNSAN